MNKPSNVFIYGTLMFKDVWDRLIGHSYEMQGAVLHGWTRLKVKGHVYPGILSREACSVKGVIVKNISNEHLNVLDKFEDPIYERIQVEVVVENKVIHQAYTYAVPQQRAHVLEEFEWRPDDFERTGLRAFLEGYYGFYEGF